MVSISVCLLRPWYIAQSLIFPKTGRQSSVCISAVGIHHPKIGFTTVKLRQSQPWFWVDLTPLWKKILTAWCSLSVDAFSPSCAFSLPFFYLVVSAVSCIHFPIDWMRETLSNAVSTWEPGTHISTMVFVLPIIDLCRTRLEPGSIKIAMVYPPSSVKQTPAFIQYSKPKKNQYAIQSCLCSRFCDPCGCQSPCS